MGHTPADDGREVFGAVLTEPLDGGDFVDAQGARGRPAEDHRSRRRRDAQAADAAGLRPGADAPDGAARRHPADRRRRDRRAARRDQAVPARRRGRVRLLARRRMPAGAGSRRGRWRSSRPRSSRVSSRRASSCGRRSATSRASGSRRARATRGSASEPPIEYPGGRVAETTLWILEPGLPRASRRRPCRRGRRGLPSRRRP